MSIRDRWACQVGLKKRFAWILRIGINFFAFLGICLIGYELIAKWSGSRWKLVDTYAPFVGSLLTLLGTLCTIVSIYFYTERTTQPEWMSKYITAPVIGVACVITLYILYIDGSVPANVVNGFAILAIAGSLLRIQPHPMRDEWLFRGGSSSNRVSHDGTNA